MSRQGGRSENGDKRPLEKRGASERFLIGWNHPIKKKTLKINKVEHVLIEKVAQLFRNML